MTLRHLKIFVTVYQEMNITRASELLHLAQPSVSTAIKELEDHYGISLFDRINRRIHATEKGTEFYSYANDIIQRFEEMESSIPGMAQTEKLHVGSSITIGNYIIPDLLKEFRKKHRSCEVKVTIQNSQNIMQAVLKNELDLGLVEDQVVNEHLCQRVFMKDQLCFACGREHPLAEKEQITLEMICGYPFFMRERGSAGREITDHMIRSKGIKYHISWESVSNQALLRAIEAEPGITVLSEKILQSAVAAGRIAVLPLHPEEFDRCFRLIFHKKKHITDVLNDFICVVYGLNR